MDLEVHTGKTKVKLCNQYVTDYYNALLWGNAVKYIIIAINFILRMFMIKICMFMGKPTYSEETELITTSVFVI